MSMDIGGAIKLIATDVVVPADSTVTAAAGDFTAVEIPIRASRSGSVFFYAKGSNASSSGNLIFTFQVSPDADRGDSGVATWRDDEAKTIALSGISVITDDTSQYQLEPAGYSFMRLGSIQNTDAAYSATANGVVNLGV